MLLPLLLLLIIIKFQPERCWPAHQILSNLTRLGHTQQQVASLMAGITNYGFLPQKLRAITARLRE